MSLKLLILYQLSLLDTRFLFLFLLELSDEELLELDELDDPLFYLRVMGTFATGFSFDDESDEDDDDTTDDESSDSFPFFI